MAVKCPKCDNCMVARVCPPCKSLQSAQICTAIPDNIQAKQWQKTTTTENNTEIIKGLTSCTCSHGRDVPC